MISPEAQADSDTDPADNVAVSLRGVTKIYDNGVVALGPIDLEVERPERGDATVIGLGRALQADREIRDIGAGGQGLALTRQFLGRRSRPTPLLMKRSV